VKIIKGNLEGIHILQLVPIEDERGSFMRTYDKTLMRDAGLAREWVQENRSRNKGAGIIRGLHFQFPPHAETKLVQCIRGEILDVFVDLRADSPTFGRWDSVVLSEENHKAVFIPKGFAHGYCTISEESEVSYKVDSAYAPNSEGGILWNDPDIAIPWPMKGGAARLSEKDGKHPTLKQFRAENGGLVV
jgi:dTDP-4-dehydrorhamnose 3,5-epimerase